MSRPKLIFSDFDGTLTNADGHLTPDFFKILNLCQEIPFVIVSGRGLPWGQFLMSHFPLRNAIMEGGGVILFRNEQGLLDHNYLVSPELRLKLRETAHELVKRFPALSLSADSIGRYTDQAIELRLLHDKDLRQETQDFLTEEGASFSCSNVHLNFWFGEISKARACTYFLERFKGEITIEDCLFFGDAPNDQSMFEVFPHSVGVGNLREHWDELDFKPKQVQEEKYSQGVLSYLADLEL